MDLRGKRDIFWINAVIEYEKMEIKFRRLGEPTQIVKYENGLLMFQYKKFKINTKGLLTSKKKNKFD